jgi:hypothetical protein
MVITLITIGYGDFYPKSSQGEIFMGFTIIYILVIKLPIQSGELFRLYNLKSPYARKEYILNAEVSHIIITG